MRGPASADWVQTGGSEFPIERVHYSTLRPHSTIGYVTLPDMLLAVRLRCSINRTCHPKPIDVPRRLWGKGHADGDSLPRR